MGTVISIALSVILAIWIGISIKKIVVNLKNGKCSCGCSGEADCSRCNKMYK